MFIRTPLPTEDQNVAHSRNRQYSDIVSEGPWIEVKTPRRYTTDEKTMRGVKKEQPVYVYLRNIYVEINETEHSYQV